MQLTFGVFRPLLVACSLLASSISLASAKTVSSTILVFARNAAEATSGTSGLKAYGIPYELILVPQGGVTLPTLNSSTVGNYGGVIVMSEVAYEYSTGWASGITAAQWQAIYDYQTAFGVRLARLDVYPGPEFGVTTTINEQGCCDSGVEQLVSFTDTSDFPTANIKVGAGMTTMSQWHYPATITNSTLAKQIAQFAAGGPFNSASTAAVINNFGNRQQMVWFTSWGTDWSVTSNFLQHAHIHWVTRGLFLGQRRILFSAQVDDVHLTTEIYQSTDIFRIRTSDLSAHATWQANLNARLPAGSSFRIELAHNGNGNIEAAVAADTTGECIPDSSINLLDYPPSTPLEFVKPIGSGTNLWPDTPLTYSWSLACTKLDPIGNWFQSTTNRDEFFHLSHTFSHEALNNATDSDARQEIRFNQAWLTQVGIAAGRFSPQGIVPPAITGLHNGDVIREWMANGITSVVGDNTRPPLLNTENEHWPLISTVAANGWDGLTIIPRWSTPIYYNCYSAACTLAEWINTSGGSGDFNSLLEYSRSTYVHHLLGLRHDPMMLHQANLRQGDTGSFTVGPVTGQLSLYQIFVEVVLQEMMRLTTWPIITKKHDDIGQAFLDRMTVDKCSPNLTYIYSADNTKITGVTLGATNNSCSKPIPVQFPVSATTNASGVTNEQLGTDPLTKWTTLSGSAVTFTFSTPIPV
ncbi:hypothetical protein BKA65DRAFT_466259 [Rhexocercosporidium sp. MPI-PUGE-AT-0058]|nr:hypothetical protein BKA65DRAFT_466259 [Rhexocercosporidium sp. MPI-PUGE-AT-0058]